MVTSHLGSFCSQQLHKTKLMGNYLVEDMGIQEPRAINTINEELLRQWIKGIADLPQRYHHLV